MSISSLFLKKIEDCSYSLYPENISLYFLEKYFLSHYPNHEHHGSPRRSPYRQFQTMTMKRWRDTSRSGSHMTLSYRPPAYRWYGLWDRRTDTRTRCLYTQHHHCHRLFACIPRETRGKGGQWMICRENHDTGMIYRCSRALTRESGYHLVRVISLQHRIWDKHQAPTRLGQTWMIHGHLRDHLAKKFHPWSHPSASGKWIRRNGDNRRQNAHHPVSRTHPSCTFYPPARGMDGQLLHSSQTDIWYIPPETWEPSRRTSGYWARKTRGIHVWAAQWLL